MHRDYRSSIGFDDDDDDDDDDIGAIQGVERGYFGVM